MDTALAAILDEARAQIARGEEPDAGALTARIEALPGHDRALAQLNRLLAVARAKRTLAPAAPQQQAMTTTRQPPARREVYRATPTIAANITVRAREHQGGVVLEWDAVRGVEAWTARIADRPDARSPYTDRETVELASPTLELELDDLPKRISVTGRNSAGRIVQ